MVRIGISVEGTTEERFVKVVIAPYFETKGIYVYPISISGNVNVDRIRNELKSISNSFDYVTTFYDYYGFRGKKIDETKESLEEEIKNTVHESVRKKLIPYVQMYEFEGLLFSSPESMARVLNKESVKNWAQRILLEFNNNPEKINDSNQTAPSKRLLGKTGYRKIVHGPDIAKDIGLMKIREMCFGFNTWLKLLEEKDHV